MKIILKGGSVYDGAGNPPMQAELFLDQGVIWRIVPRGSEVGKALERAWEKDAVILDVRGKAVTPGFIDSHRHGDFAVFTNPDFGKAELAQGITTAFFGNCGMSAAPTAEWSKKEWYDFMEPCLGKAPFGKQFLSMGTYFQEAAKQKLPLQTGSLVGMGSVRTAVKGFSSSPWTEREQKKGQELIREALEAGAMGISCGIMYTPECYTSTEEYVELLKPAAAYGRPLCCHIRSEGNHLAEAVDEVIAIGQKTGLPVNISHFKVFGRQNWKKTLHRAIEQIERARGEGQDVTVDFYPYTAGSTTLMTLIPPCCLKETIEKTIDFLCSDKGLALLRKEIMKEQPDWDNMVQSIGWERVIVSFAQNNKDCQGLTIPEICRRMGDEDEAACMARILCEENGNVGIIVMSMAPEDVDTVARLPYSAVISDGLYGAGEFPHPRLYGAFPRILRDFVRERGILSMQQAIYKMSGLTAQRFRMKDRGLIQEGMRADLNVLDLEKVRDTATFQVPRALAEGVEYVLVGGNVVWNQGKLERDFSAGMLLAGNANEKNKGE